MLQIGFLEASEGSFILNKAGGSPSYLGKGLEQQYCGTCLESMMFLMQLFTPEDTQGEDVQEIDRMMHVFVCPKNHEVAVFRSQSVSNNSIDQTLKIKKGTEAWPEWEIVSEDFDEIQLQNSMQNYNLQEKFTKIENDEMLENEEESTVQVDDTFLKYQTEIGFEPDQVLRYYRTDYSRENIEPLWVSDVGKCLEIPDCTYCGGKRSLEFQITSQILNFLQIDHSQTDAFDFGTLIIYSCSKSCSSDTEFMTEYCWRQEFSTDGIKLPCKNPIDVIR